MTTPSTLLVSALTVWMLSACGANGAADDAGASIDTDAAADTTATDASNVDAGSDTGAGGLDSGSDADAGDGEAGSDAGPPARGVVHVVLFTHIEDNTPAGTLGSSASRMSYLRLRGRLLEMGALARDYALQWVLQPDWKFLEAALLYEDDTTTADTGGQSLFVYLRDSLGVVVDPHSHENGGYNYTDVAHLLELLGVGGSTVIGGHIWDPSLPQFQEWDRFRVEVLGEHYPTASWRGDILIGAGTPNHVNDPLVSGVWRPQDRDHFFNDDPAGNIVAIGAWTRDLAGVEDLVALYADGTVPPDQMLTASWNIGPSMLMAANGIADIEASIIMPVAALRDEDAVVATDFTTLVEVWRTQYRAEGALYQP